MISVKLITFFWLSHITIADAGFVHYLIICTCVALHEIN
jgi:hypothetical protein